VNEGLVSLNGDVELASDTGHELGLPALMFPTTLLAVLKPHIVPETFS